MVGTVTRQRGTTGQQIVSGYDAARERIRATEQRELSAKEYLDTVAPGKRTTKSARDYIRRMRSGERSGTTLAERAQKDSGKTVRVEYRVGSRMDAQTGRMVDDIRSQNVTIPSSRSRLDLYRTDLRATFDRGLAQSWNRRSTGPQKRLGYEPLAKLPVGAELVRVYRPKHHRRRAVVLQVEGP